MSKEWGHGFHNGRQAGEKWGELIAAGDWETRMSEISSRLLILANALRFPVEFQSGRTETWWQLYASSIAGQIAGIAKELPGFAAGVYEFEKDIPQEK
jgi:hypothetical protein